MVSVGSTIPITEQAVRANLVVIGPRLALRRWNSRDAEWRVAQLRWAKDSLRGDEVNAVTLEFETLLKQGAGKDLSVDLRQMLQVLERRKADPAILHGVGHARRRPVMGAPGGG
jgi:hypothetical protein